MCVPILKSIGSELTACDAKTLRHASWGLDTSDRYFDRSYGSNSGFRVFGDLDLDLDL